MVINPNYCTIDLTYIEGMFIRLIFYLLTLTRKDFLSLAQFNKGILAIQNDKFVD